jgi:formimidoylglutamate deiminase
LLSSDEAVQRDLFFDDALLTTGWSRSVRLGLADGAITSVAANVTRDGAEHTPGVAVPGLINLHSHAFQRGMAGLAERRGPADDSFWTWREVMYRFLGALTPDDVEAIAALAYMEMLEAGFTAVAEFHYLHHDIDGRPYSDLGEMCERIAAAAAQTHIGLTLLPSLYMAGGFNGAPATPGQRRFVNDLDHFLKLVERARQIVASLPGASMGIAPHSLRAVPADALRQLVDTCPDMRVHIHAAEQLREVEECVAALGARPVEWLLANAGVDARWCLIHATHMTAEETAALARSGAVAGLCPLTEASLGDGIFPAAEFLGAGGRFGVGTDSNIQIDAAAELRQLEYGQRLSHRARNVLTPEAGEATGRRLYREALAAGAQAVGRTGAGLEVGRPADIVALDVSHLDLAAVRDDQWLDKWIFVAGKSAVETVMARGQTVVANGRHVSRDVI